MLCPYCSTREADSRDHVFSDFLGGRATVSACTPCNTKVFGRGFEAAALTHLKNLMFFLRRSGMQPSKPMVWKGVAVDSSGERYDIDQDLKAFPSKPSIERGKGGQIIGAKGARKQIKQIARHMEREGSIGRVMEEKPVTIDMQQLRIVFPMDDDMKRLCVKMAVAAPLKLGLVVPLDSRARHYLLAGDRSDVCPARIAIDEYIDLDQRRPPCGHLIYTRASSTEHRAYAIVQFFAAIQFYCELAGNYDGPDWATLATHDPITHVEAFNPTAQLDYPLPGRYVSGNFNDRMFHRFERLRLELVALYGDQAPSAFFPNR